VRTVVHFAEVADAGPEWQVAQKSNVRGAMNALEPARAGVTLYFVYRSSHDVTGEYERERPDNATVAGAYLRPPEPRRSL